MSPVISDGCMHGETKQVSLRMYYGCQELGDAAAYAPVYTTDDMK